MECPNHSYNHSLTPEVPGSVDASRSPQWNTVNCGCACGCPCSLGAGDEDGMGMSIVRSTGYESSSPSDSLMLERSSYAASYAGSVNSDHEDNVNGDQGVEDHFIEVGDLGFARLRDIHWALARYNRCSCHRGIPQRSQDHRFVPFDSPRESSFLPSSMLASANSMTAEMSSRLSDSAVSSPPLPGMASADSSAFLAFTGEGARQDSAYSRDHIVISRPLRPTPERGSSNDLNAEGHYPAQLSGSDFPLFDCW